MFSKNNTERRKDAMMILIIGLLALIIAYVSSHLVFASKISIKRRLAFFLVSIASLYIAIGSTVFTLSHMGG
ncbi:hypothetical protein [Staphylococcus aureus]|uniref:hypothetical protein n=2 Tax=Staphylococcus TaxID=1279 RepID=UPI001CBA64A6|nr:hypothetical protein [Staphylococcus aureus]